MAAQEKPPDRQDAPEAEGEEVQAVLDQVEQAFDAAQADNDTEGRSIHERVAAVVGVIDTGLAQLRGLLEDAEEKE